MPELPELEVIRRQIEPLMVGRTVSRVGTTAESNFFLTKPAVLKRHLSGRRVRALERVGKYLVASLDDGSRLLLHLGMTGQLFGAGVDSPRLSSPVARARSAVRTEKQKFKPDLHTHLRLSFRDGGQELFLRDVRRFGRVQVLKPGESCARLDRLGVDALVATGAHLFAMARKRRIAIKSLLLDQSVVAGIGNIYADEALFLAGIRPSRTACRLTGRQCIELMEAARRVMLRSIETGGSSIRDYLQPNGSDGGYQNERLVYARAGRPCVRCESPIVRTVIGQRPAHYCPKCQPAK